MRVSDKRVGRTHSATSEAASAWWFRSDTWFCPSPTQWERIRSRRLVLKHWLMPLLLLWWQHVYCSHTFVCGIQALSCKSQSQSSEKKKLRGFIDFCERNIFTETLSKPINSVSKYLLGSKTIRLNRALHYPKQQSNVFHVENCDMKTRRVEDPSIGRAS